MKLCITSGNYHIFLLMMRNHQDSRIVISKMTPRDFDLIVDIDTQLDQDTVISILKHELRYSPFMYLCPFYQIIPYQQHTANGHKEKNPSSLHLQYD